jgi:hypothetical protein
MPTLAQSLRLEADQFLREAEGTADTDAKAALIVKASRLHAHALRLETLWPTGQARFQVRRDRDARGRPEGWYVEDTETWMVVGRFRSRADAQAHADKANARMATSDAATF